METIDLFLVGIWVLMFVLFVYSYGEMKYASGRVDQLDEIIECAKQVEKENKKMKGGK